MKMKSRKKKKKNKRKLILAEKDLKKRWLKIIMNSKNKMMQLVMKIFSHL